MEKIICSLEEWDSIINYYRPNGSSKTWYIKELRKLTRPLMWGDWNIYTESGEMFDVGVFQSIITPYYSKKIEYLQYDKIEDNKHIYIINIYNVQFFNDNKEIGFKCISQKYLEDVRNGKSKIVMFFLFEGYSGSHGNNDLEIIEKWRIEAGLPVDSVYYVCGNLLCRILVNQKGYGYQARPVHHFEPWNKYDDPNIVEFKPVDNKYLFLSYNRAPRQHRVVFIIELMKQKLLNIGMVSLNKLIQDVPDDTPIEISEYLRNYTPLVIDEKYDLNYNLAINITKEDYEKTFVSVVTETLVDQGTIFFSEKIWKPIMVGHPFILLGNRFSLKYLKNIGYKTFDKWIDESYDNEADVSTRVKMIVNELKKFNSKSINELKKIREEMNEVCEYNKKHYNESYRMNYDDGDVSTSISNILDEVWKELN